MGTKTLSSLTAAAIAASTAFATISAQASNVEDGPELNIQGQALGGNMRSGPGTNFGKVSSLAEGTYVTILFNTGQNFDGYNWFEVVLDNSRRGFIWGGILCSNGSQLPGIYSSCANYQQQASKPQNQSQNNRGWMAFAVGNNGRWGHGAGRTLSDARQYAMSNCGEAGCELIDETQAQCHALATVPGGFWFGAANSSNQAERYAVDFCINAGGNGCRIEYTYCQ